MFNKAKISRSALTFVIVGCVLAGFAGVWWFGSKAASNPAADINLDGQVNVFDLSVLLSHWSNTGTAVAGDINGDNVVNVYDLSLLLANWGVAATPTPTPVPGSGDTSTPLNLDVTGATIPDTNYAIPAGAIFMDDTGNDANAGTQAAPVKTLNRAISMAPNPGTIVVRAGTYRDWYYPAANPDSMGNAIGKGLTFQAYPHEQVWFDGTDVVSSGWTANGDGTWSVPWSTPSFCFNKYYTVPIGSQSVSPNTGPCYHWDMSGDPSNPRAGDPQMAFINGSYVHQVVTRAEVSNNPGNFFYDHAARVLYIGTSPSGKTVELTKRPQALFLGGARAQVKGIGFRRYATTEFEGVPASALYIGGSSATPGDSLVENSVFKDMAGGAFTMRARGGIARHNALVNNGYTAMGSNGHAQGDEQSDGLLIENSLFSNNNTEKFGTGCGPSCGHAAVKIAHMIDFTVRNNIFEKTYGNGAGFWCDNDCRGGKIVRNIARYNGGDGLFYEVSDTGIIASNLVYNNTQQGIRVAASNTQIYNNTLVNNSLIGMWIYDDNRNANDTHGSDIGPDTRNVKMFNNILYGGSVTTMKLSQGSNDQWGLNTGPNEFMTGLDYNSYYRAEGSGRSMINWVDDTLTGNYKSLTEMRTQHPGLELNGHDTYSPAADPFFVNLAAGNYVVRSGSVAYNSGTAIPADVAAAVGMPTAAGQSRGAYTWPGKP